MEILSTFKRLNSLRPWKCSMFFFISSSFLWALQCFFFILMKNFFLSFLFVPSWIVLCFQYLHLISYSSIKTRKLSVNRRRKKTFSLARLQPDFPQQYFSSFFNHLNSQFSVGRAFKRASGKTLKVRLEF